MFLALLAIIVIIIIVWVVYAVSAAHQQTLTIIIPFEETYRYVPNLDKNHKFKLDTIKVKITGIIKKDSLSGSTIVPANNIKDLVRDNIISPYKGCLTCS